MSTMYWVGSAPAVAQKQTLQITADDAATSYQTTIGNVYGSGTGVNNTATALQVALAASTHPYFVAIVWTVLTDTVTGTARVAGVPFEASTIATGGTGGVTETNTVANSGPSDVGIAANYSGLVLPIDGDTLIVANNSVPMSYNLRAMQGVSLTLLRRDMTHTGFIGLPSNSFATDVNGGSPNYTVPEYRATYLRFGGTLNAMKVDLGQNFSSDATASGAGIKIDTQDTVTTMTVFNTPNSAYPGTLAAVQWLPYTGSSSNVLYVRNAPGGVGVCVGAGEVGVVGTIDISDLTIYSKVATGPGLTFTTLTTTGGTNNIAYTALTTASISGGITTINGSANVTTVNSYGGTLKNNISGTQTTVNLKGGIIDCRDNTFALTATTLNIQAGTLYQSRAGISAETIAVNSLNNSIVTA